MSGPQRIQLDTERLHCLIAEDEPGSRRLLERMLTAFGAKCSLASNGVEAVALARQQRFSCVFMDCYMPELDGLQAAREIRHFDTRLPIVAVTAANIEHECSAAGMDYFIAKPIAMRDLRLAFDFLQLTVS